MKRRIVELESGNFSYQFKIFDRDEWNDGDIRVTSKEEAIEHVKCLVKSDKDKIIKNIFEEIYE